MTMIPTPTGYKLLAPSIDYRGVPAPTRFGCFVTPRPAHRAGMTAEQSAKNLGTRSGYVPQPEHGAHRAPLTDWAAWVAENDAQVREIILGGSR